MNETSCARDHEWQATVYPEGIFTRVFRELTVPFALKPAYHLDHLLADLRPYACFVPPLHLGSFLDLALPRSLLAASPNCVLVCLVLAQGRSPLACLVSLTLSASACLAALSFLRCNSFSSTSRIRTLALLTFAAGFSISRSRVKTVFTF